MLERHGGDANSATLNGRQASHLGGLKSPAQMGALKGETTVKEARGVRLAENGFGSVIYGSKINPMSTMHMTSPSH